MLSILTASGIIIYVGVALAIGWRCRAKAHGLGSPGSQSAGWAYGASSSASMRLQSRDRRA